MRYWILTKSNTTLESVLTQLLPTQSTCKLVYVCCMYACYKINMFKPNATMENLHWFNNTTITILYLFALALKSCIFPVKTTTTLFTNDTRTKLVWLSRCICLSSKWSCLIFVKKSSQRDRKVSNSVIYFLTSRKAPMSIKFDRFYSWWYLHFHKIKCFLRRPYTCFQCHFLVCVYICLYILSPYILSPYIHDEGRRLFLFSHRVHDINKTDLVD